MLSLIVTIIFEAIHLNACLALKLSVQDNWQSVMFAMAGGVVLSIGNLSTQYAFALVGLSVTEVITASITVVIGISIDIISPKSVLASLKQREKFSNIPNEYPST